MATKKKGSRAKKTLSAKSMKKVSGGVRKAGGTQMEYLKLS
jgi:hypothetical protein